MKEGLLTPEIKISLEKIIQHCFYGNRIVDRICSLLSVSFVMSRTEHIIHEGYAHLLPLLADDISNYMGDRNCTTIYGSTPVGDQEYSSITECFGQMLEINLKLETLVKESIVLSEEVGDYTTKVFLENFLLKLIGLTSDILLLIDKSERYGESEKDLMNFDHDVSDFNVFGVN